jgi:REP element-mobilizing transposase RayT
VALNPAAHHRRSIRLPGRDYGRPNGYFVTVCVLEKMCLFGAVQNGEMILNDNGKIVSEEWKGLGRRFSSVYLDAWVVMPNHLHGIVWLREVSGDSAVAQQVGTQQRAPTHSDSAPESAVKRKPLGQIVGAFKTAVTRRINERDGTVGQTIWQRNYYERVIRNQQELLRTQTYIRANPSQWPRDEENPANARPTGANPSPNV